MSIDKNIILAPSILNAAESDAVIETLTRLVIYAREIPVAHYRKDPNDPKGGQIIDFDKNGDLFKESYSDILIRSQHTGRELAKMLKLFCTQKTNSDAAKATLDKAWKWFTYQVPDQLDQIPSDEAAKKTDTYKYFIKAEIVLLDSFTKIVDLFLRGIDIGDSKKSAFNYASEYFDKPFRKNAEEDGLNYLLPNDEKTQNLIRTLSSTRNKKEHYDNSVFREPSDPDELFEYCKRLHFSINFYMLLLTSRFYDEFWKKLVQDRHVVDCSEIEEELQGISKQLLKRFYIERVHNEAHAKMCALFQGTGIRNREGLLNDLPEIHLKGQDKDGNEVIGDCVEMLVENPANKRRLIVGEPGSGKSVMFMRMLQRDQPMATPFFFELKDFRLDNAGTPEEVVAHLKSVIEERVIHEENITINKGVKNATLERVYELLERGSAVFFIDSVDSAMENIANLVKFIETYPECQYIIGTQPDAVPQELIDAGFSRFEVMPLNDAQMKKIMKMVSLQMSNTDHTDLLDSKIRTLTNDMSRNPFTLMQIITLLESGSKKISMSTNRANLYWSIYWKIMTSSNLEEEEKREIVGRGFMVRFLEKVESVCQLCSAVVKEFNAQGDWKRMIMEYPMIMEGNPASWRGMFEIMEIIRLRYPHRKDEAHLFRTLVTSAILESGISSECGTAARLTVDENGRFSLSENGTLPMPNPLLKKLAAATATIQDNTQSQQEDETESLTESIIYKMQPRQIIRHYIMTLMNVYKDACVDARKHQKQLCELFYCIAYSGDAKLINKLFTPFWMERWLMVDKDKIYALDYNGSAVEKSPLPRILIKKCVNLSHLGLRLMQQYNWIHAWNMRFTKAVWERLMRDMIVYEMNDEQRERFFCKTDMKMTDLVSQETLSYYRNMAIVSMENIWLADRYDYSYTTTYEPELYNRLMQHGSNPNALSILIHQFDGLLKKEDTQSTEGIFMYLIKHQSAMTDEQKNRLWTSMKESAKNDQGQVRSLANRVPIEDIDPELAHMIYDERIYRQIISIKNREREKADRWISQNTGSFNRHLYLDSTRLLKNGGRVQSKYTFYCQNNAYTITLATECIDEMPEHRFCRIDDYDQWFYVEDVVVLGKEKDLEHIAEITLWIPNGSDRARNGFITLSDGRRIPYIHMFHIKSSQQAVIRIDDQESVKWLMEERNVEFLKENRDALLNDTAVRLTGIDTRSIDQNMRLVILTAVGNPRNVKENRYVDPKHVKVDLPHTGYISFYNTKDPDRKCNNRLLLKVLAEENVTTWPSIENVIYLGSSGDRHYITAHTRISPGHVLKWTKSPFAGKVTKVSAMFGITDIGKMGLPDNVVGQYRTFYFNSMKTAKKENLSRTSLYNGSISIIEFELITAAKKELYTPGKLISEKIMLQFYHPIAEPDLGSWRPKQYETILDSCKGTVVRVDNVLVIRVPATAYPMELKYFHTEVLPKRMPLKWHRSKTESGKHAFIRLDKTVAGLFKEDGTHSITFYSDSNDETASPIKFERFSDLIDITKPRRYHPDITPFLISEWVCEGDVDYRKLNFCKDRKYADLLVQQCKRYGVELKKEYNETDSPTH
jgi:hypothetical protein